MKGGTYGDACDVTGARRRQAPGHRAGRTARAPVPRDPRHRPDGAYWLIGIGIVGALVAAVFGILDLLAIPRGTPAFRTALTHMALNLTVVALFVVGFALRRGDLDDVDGTPTGPLSVSVLALVVLGVSGWLGGKLTYRYGVGVVDQADQG